MNKDVEIIKEPCSAPITIFDSRRSLMSNPPILEVPSKIHPSGGR